MSLPIIENQVLTKPIFTGARPLISNGTSIRSVEVPTLASFAFVQACSRDKTIFEEIESHLCEDNVSGNKVCHEKILAADITAWQALRELIQSLTYAPVRSDKVASLAPISSPFPTISKILPLTSRTPFQPLSLLSENGLGNPAFAKDFTRSSPRTLPDSSSTEDAIGEFPRKFRGRIAKLLRQWLQIFYWGKFLIVHKDEDLQSPLLQRFSDGILSMEPSISADALVRPSGHSEQSPDCAISGWVDFCAWDADLYSPIEPLQSSSKPANLASLSTRYSDGSSRSASCDRHVTGTIRNSLISACTHAGYTYTEDDIRAAVDATFKHYRKRYAYEVQHYCIQRVLHGRIDKVSRLDECDRNCILMDRDGWEDNPPFNPRGGGE